MPRHDKYELRVLQEAAIDGYYGSGGYNIGGYTMVVFSSLHKQLCWEFRVSHNCVCIISEGPLMYVVTCLGTFCNLIDSCNLVLRFSLN